MANILKYNSEAQLAVLNGVTKVAEAVISTYGPNGRNVIIEVEGLPPHITKDGVTVASAIELKDPFESIGALLILEAALKTLKDVGDGTSATTLLAYNIIKEGVKELQYNVDAFKLKEGLDTLSTLVVEDLKRCSKLISDTPEDLLEVAKVSTNNDLELSLVLYEIFNVVGKDGNISIEQSISPTHYNIIEGFQIPYGYDNPLFLKGESKEIVYNNPYIYLQKTPIKSIGEIIDVIKETQLSKIPLVIIAPDINKEVLDTLLVNNYQLVLDVVFIKMVTHTTTGENSINDLSIVIGNQFNVKSSVLGLTAKVIINRDSTSFIPLETNKDSINKLKDSINDSLNSELDSTSKEKIEKRLANISGKVANLYLKANSDIEYKEKLDKLDDTINAIKAALNEGVVLGAGITLAACAESVYLNNYPSCKDKDILVGYDIINKVCLIPKSILIRGSNTFYNILDPVKVVYTSLLNAVNIAGLFLTTNCVIVNEK